MQKALNYSENPPTPYSLP